MSMNKNEEPNTAPHPDRWYTLSLGSSFKDHQPSSKFCTLRYEFKPASIDKSQPGALHKTKDNKISVEFHNNQPGKPKVTFEGNSEDYKENDAVLFFDGHSFRLERLHHVKRLRHVRLPGEFAAATLAASSAAEVGSPLLGKGAKAQPQPQPQPQAQSQSHSQAFNRGPAFTAPQQQLHRQAPTLPQPPPPQQQQQALLAPPPPLPPVSVEVDRIDIGDAGNSENLKSDKPSSTPQQTNVLVSPDSKDFDLEEHLDIMNGDEEEESGLDKDVGAEKLVHTGIDINMPQQNDTDDDITDVDINDDSGGIAGNAAAALRAQVNNAVEKENRSSSSSSSGSGSSGSSSGSGSSHSSSDSESSDGDSVNSI